MMHKLIRKLSFIFFIPFTVLCGLTLVVSLCTTIYYDTDQGADLPRFGSQNYLVLIIGVLLFFFISRVLIKTENKKLFPLCVVLEAVLCLIIIISVRATAVTDGLTLDNVINAFNDGNYSSLEKGGYMFVYSFQIGYVWIGQFLAYVFGPSNYFVYQLINLVSIVLSVVYLHFITWEIFEKKEVLAVYDIMSLLLFFLFSYVTYVYNDVWSFAPGIMALYYEILYLKREKIQYGVAAAVSLGVACLLKTNLYIALIAMVILLWVSLWNEHLLWKYKDRVNSKIKKKFKESIILTFLMLICAIMPLKLLGSVYADKAGLSEYPGGVPKSTYFAMAMQEGEGEGGWYNGYNWNTYAANDYDVDKTNKEAKTFISERLLEFADRPLHAGKFYFRKFMSQWADPTFVSIRNLELSSRHSDTDSAFARSLVFGTWSKVFQYVMDVEHFLIFLGAFAFCVLTIKNKSLTITQALIIVFIFGGMLFHELWEGSSRYIIRYYLCLMPFAAYGLTALITAKSAKE